MHQKRWELLTKKENVDQRSGLASFIEARPLFYIKECMS